MCGNLSSALTATRAELEATKRERDGWKRECDRQAEKIAAYSDPPDSDDVSWAAGWATFLENTFSCQKDRIPTPDEMAAMALARALRSAQVMIEERQNDVNELVVMNATSKKRAEAAEARVKELEAERDSALIMNYKEAAEKHLARAEAAEARFKELETKLSECRCWKDEHCPLHSVGIAAAVAETCALKAKLDEAVRLLDNLVDDDCFNECGHKLGARKFIAANGGKP